MKARRTRISRILELREKELAQKAQQLRDARDQHLRAQQENDNSMAALRSAEATRIALADQGASVLEFLQNEDWLHTRRVHQEVSAHRLSRARARLDAHQNAVHQARTRVKQLELLRERLDQQRLDEERSRERRTEDEMAQRLARHGR